MLLNNNNNNNEMDNVVYRRPKQTETSRGKTSGGGGGGGSGGGSGGGGGSSGSGSSSGNRNSWSFTNEVPARKSVAKEQQSIYADPEGLKCGSRARLRQRSVSNLTAGVKSRDQSSGYSGSKLGTIKCDYIRINPSTIRVLPDQLELDLDRSEFGSPDGHSNPESASSTAERELAAHPVLPVPELYQAINQNKSNDYKVTQHRRIPVSDPHSAVASALPPTATATATAAAAAAAAAATATTSTTTGADVEVTLRNRSTSGRSSGRNHANRKSMAPTCGSSGSHSGGSRAVKTEWTFLPSAPVTKPEISSTPEVPIFSFPISKLSYHYY